MKSRSKNKAVVGSDYVLEFGKHKGKAIWWILMNDCGYVVWLVDNDVLSLSDGIYEECKDRYSEMDYGDDYYASAVDIY